MQLITYREIQDRYGDHLARKFLIVIEKAAPRQSNIVLFDRERRLRVALKALNENKPELVAHNEVHHVSDKRTTN